MSDVTIREWIPAEHALVYSTWIRSSGARGPRECARERALIEMLLRRGAVVRVAVWEDSALVLGWACVEGEVCHAVYTKMVYRGSGIARMLLADCTVATCRGTGLPVDEGKL